MNALVWKGNGMLSLERRPVPELQGPRQKPDCYTGGKEAWS